MKPTSAQAYREQKRYMRIGGQWHPYSRKLWQINPGACSIEGCHERIAARGLCRNHYAQERYRRRLAFP